MIGRGKHNDIYLYEVTEQDLLLGEAEHSVYRAGNVLMFAEKRDATLGREFACADDLCAAKEFLDSDTASRGGDIRALTEKIEQRDELLRDLSESLKSQQQVNSVLHAQLEQARKQLAADELRQSEMVDDLQSVSVETHTIESTLERVMEEKYRLEEELAERITELVDLDLQNDDLRKRLVETRTTLETCVVSAPVPATVVPQGSYTSVAEVTQVAAEPTSHTGERQLKSRGRQYEDSRIIMTASGKQIHIMHEFPVVSKRTMLARFGHSLVSGLRVAAIIVFAVLIIGVGSVMVTANLNNIPYGAALDLVLVNLGLSSFTG